MILESRTTVVATGPRREWAQGWRTLLASFVAMATAWNVVSIVLSVFLVPMQAEFGWSRTALSISPIVTLLSACLLPITGVLLDRFGPRRIALAGTVAMAVALGLFGFAGTDPAIFIFLITLLSIAAATMNSLVLARGVAGWFDQRLGTAFGILFSGVSVSLFLLVLLIGGIVARHGWRAGFFSMSAIALFVSLPVLFMLFREPTAASTSGAASVPDAFVTLAALPRFRLLVLACLTASIPNGGVIGHLVPILAGRGLSLVAATGYASIFALSIGVSGLATGVLFDRTRAKIVAAATLMLSGLGSALLLFLPPGGGTIVAVAVGLAGLAIGIIGNCISYFPARLFGMRNFSRVTSLMALTISVGMAAGGLVFAAIFDRFGNYGQVLGAGTLIYLSAAAMFLFLPAQNSRPSSAG